MTVNVAPPEAARLLRTERTLVTIRWVAVAFAFLQVLTYYLPYPPAVLPAALAISATLGLGNLCLWRATRRDLDARGTHRVVRSAMVLETVVTSAFVYLFTFDPNTAVWALLYILPLLGAIRFGFRGALWVMTAAGVLYTVREFFGYWIYGTDLLATSISFRLGIGFIIASVAGSMAASLTRDRERLEETVGALADEKASSESVLNAISGAGVGLVVGDGRRILDANEAHCRITGYSRDELLALSPWDVVDESERPRVEEHFGRALAGEVHLAPLETWMWRKDGERVDIELSINVLRSGAGPKFVTVVRDISERKRLDRMKDTFLSAVSHELRTPLTAVLGFAVTLEDDRIPDDLKRDIVKRLARGARKLDRLLSDLLDLDRMLGGSIDARRRPAELAPLVERLVAESAAQTGRKITVTADEIVADVEAAKVERIVENLIGNAAKHTPPGLDIDVRLTMAEGGVLIVVDDRGPGVDLESRELIFQPFQRGTAALGHSPGVGIGLSLVKRFAELHGGSAWVEDREGGGASFRVFLPATVRRRETVTDAEAQITDGGPPSRGEPSPVSHGDLTEPHQPAPPDQSVSRSATT